MAIKNEVAEMPASDSSGHKSDYLENSPSSNEQVCFPLLIFYTTNINNDAGSQ
jgi:hypothetical protein